MKRNVIVLIIAVIIAIYGFLTLNAPTVTENTDGAKKEVTPTTAEQKPSQPQEERNKRSVSKDGEISYMLTNFSDTNWTNGISKMEPYSFFVLNNENTKKDFSFGKKVVFSDKIERKISKVQENEGDLIIFVEGELDGEKVGYPNSVIVKK